MTTSPRLHSPLRRRQLAKTPPPPSSGTAPAHPGCANSRGSSRASVCHAIIETVFADLIDGPWRTCLRGDSGRTRPGSSARPSPTTCCAPPACSPATPTPWLVGPPCGGASSTFPPGWPAHNADWYCTYPAIGPGPRHGKHYGATLSAPHPACGRQLQPSPPDHRPPRPHPRKQESWADQRSPARPDQKSRSKQPAPTPPGFIGGSILSTAAPNLGTICSGALLPSPRRRGATISIAELDRCGGHSFARTRWRNDGAGSRDVAALATSQALRAPLPAWCGDRRILLGRIVVSRLSSTGSYPAAAQVRARTA